MIFLVLYGSHHTCSCVILFGAPQVNLGLAKFGAHPKHILTSISSILPLSQCLVRS